uniref:Uncharacterized protein n=1 Tax=Myripristis murdjan TaxID=586833 RepID=A0A667ZTY4_9TELE
MHAFIHTHTHTLTENLRLMLFSGVLSLPANTCLSTPVCLERGSCVPVVTQGIKLRRTKFEIMAKESHSVSNPSIATQVQSLLALISLCRKKEEKYNYL